LTPGRQWSQATSRTPPFRLFPAFLAGLAFAVTATAGSALLLYTTQGFLRAAGLLVGLTIGALTAGIWVGASGTSGAAARGRARWLVALAAYVAAAFGVLAWTAEPAVRAWGGSNALAMLVVLAAPAYATGLLLGGIAAAGRSASGTAALSGGAVGVLLATSSLIPRFEPPLVFAGAASLVLAALLADWRGGYHRGGYHRGGNMTASVAIVTGVSSRGQLGHTIASQLADAGWRVLVSGRSDVVHQLAAELAAAGGEVAAARADLLDETQARAVAAAALERFGRIDALVNAAGGLTLVRAVEDTHLEELQRELDRNLATALVMSRAALPALRQSRGAIVNFASPAAFQPVASLAAYSAAKAGVVALTGALAREEKAAGVRVNAIAPGTMDTEQNIAEGASTGGWVRRAAVADVVIFLLSPAARAITGETIRVLAPTAD
jgi:NAD(P)-dependent dehydrogenase (short-subunit alcohol dehydrogenase family)